MNKAWSRAKLGSVREKFIFVYLQDVIMLGKASIRGEVMNPKLEIITNKNLPKTLSEKR